MSPTHFRRSPRAQRREQRLGPTQVLIMEAIQELSTDAYGLAILDHVNDRLSAAATEELPAPIDQAQVYVTLKRLLHRKLITLADTKRVPGSPPLKVYELTTEGRQAAANASVRARTWLQALEMNRAVSRKRTS